MGNRDGLVPFTSETASLAGKRSAEARRARRDADVKRARDAARILDALGDVFTRDRIGTDAARVAGLILSRVAAGEVKVRHGEDAAALLRALVDIARLEAGEATSHAITAHVTTGQALDHVRQLRAQARRALGEAGRELESATALAADDGEQVGEGGESPGAAGEGAGEDGG